MDVRLFIVKKLHYDWHMCYFFLA